jgi:phage gpG-like protein
MAHIIRTRIYGLDKIIARLGGLGGSLEKTAILLANIGRYKLMHIRQGFKVGGPGWKPLSQNYLEFRRRLGRPHRHPNLPLYDTGSLMRSFNVTVTSKSRVKIATQDPHAPVHQDGGRTRDGYLVPKRTMAEWTTDDRKVILHKTRRHIHRGLGGQPYTRA